MLQSVFADGGRFKKSNLLIQAIFSLIIDELKGWQGEGKLKLKKC